MSVKDGKIMYSDCRMLKDFGNWRKDDQIDIIYQYADIFLYSGYNNENRSYERCILLKKIGDFEVGSKIDVIGGWINLYFWDDYGLSGDEGINM
jgi:hypothetical protein